MSWEIVHAAVLMSCSCISGFFLGVLLHIIILYRGILLSIISNANNNNHSSALACDVIGFNVIDWDTSESKAIFTQSIDQFEWTFLSVYILYETINRYSKKRNLLTHIMEIADGLIMVQNCQLICDIYVKKNISPGKWYIHISLR